MDEPPNETPAGEPAPAAAAEGAAATASPPEPPVETAAQESEGPPPAEAPPGKRPLVKRHHGIVRVAHWANAVLLRGHDRERAADLQRLPALRAPAARPYGPTPGRASRSPPGPASAAGSPAASTGTSPWPGRSSSPAWSTWSTWRSRGSGGRCSSGRGTFPGPCRCSSTICGCARSIRPRASTTPSRRPRTRSSFCSGCLATLTGLRDLQAGPALLADGAVRRLRAGPLLALLGGLDLRRVHSRPCRPGLPGGPRLDAGDDHRLVPGEVPEP